MNERRFWGEVLKALDESGDVKNEHAFRRSLINALANLNSRLSAPVTIPLPRIKTISGAVYNIVDDEADIFVVNVPEEGILITLDDGIEVGRSFTIHRDNKNESWTAAVRFPWSESPGYWDYDLITISTLKVTKLSALYYMIEMG